ncbi:ExbD/TolR family protein [Coraliomargarita akajimensis]|uniref:Biopolymer transport protein ExbD/TolR n=1 Tax=Coraliomargarita akajimensis (strain DSM 45221 / IAM 15411 / JCM 23193 / KCTC 12865 / 04OKA010-24) TaxID=583355 RepID=D5ERD6_CORAD|nr:biopolymer transporter ExbD [Coraliomargarita akajimensis]ADE55980.1 Biopolymer transport protein ExbD/TolR [Coraliomargarita akajimensis DSM 45221]
MAAVNKVLESEDKVDITPMIDVVFLLLIYFMFLPLTQEADIGIKLPSKAPPVENLELPSEHIAEVYPNGLILLNGAPMDGTESRDMPKLTHTLTRLRMSSDRAKISTVVKIQADPDSPHQRSVDILNACAKAKITKVSFAAYGE